MAEQKFYDCPFCGKKHPFKPHPTKEGRRVAYCGGRGVCEVNVLTAPRPETELELEWGEDPEPDA